MKKIFVFLFLLIATTSLKAQDFYSFDALVNPKNFNVLNDTTLLIYDKDRIEEELCLNNIYSFEILNCTRFGKGPGELSGNAVHIFLDREKKEIIIWDFGLQRITKFSDKLVYLNDSNISDRFRGVLSILPINESHQLYLRMNEDSFAEVVNIKKDSVVSVVDNENEYLFPVKNNFLLKQGYYTFDGDSESILFTSKYSSILMKISITGLDFLTLGEPNIPFPEREKNDEYGIPSLHKYTTSSLDASINQGNIYILHSGKKTKYREAFWYLVRGRILELQEKLDRGKELLVYNLKNGDFIKRLELPFEVKKAKVFNNNVYALRDTEEGAIISVIPLQDL